MTRIECVYIYIYWCIYKSCGSLPVVIKSDGWITRETCGEEMRGIGPTNDRDVRAGQLFFHFSHLLKIVSFYPVSVPAFQRQSRCSFVLLATIEPPFSRTNAKPKFLFVFVTMNCIRFFVKPRNTRRNGKTGQPSEPRRQSWTQGDKKKIEFRFFEKKSKILLRQYRE